MHKPLQLCLFLLLLNKIQCTLIKQPVSTSMLSMARLCVSKCVISFDECSPLFFFLKSPWNHTTNQRTNRSLQWCLGQLQRIREQLRVWLGQREQFQWQWVQQSVPRCHTRGTDHFTPIKLSQHILTLIHDSSFHSIHWWLLLQVFLSSAHTLQDRAKNMWKPPST